MAEYNKVILIGRLTRDPELRYTPTGTPVAQLGLAVNHTYRTREEKREETCFIEVSLFGRSAEVVKEYLQKGREILVEGRLKYDTWEGQDGQKRSRHTVVADRFQFLGGGRGADRAPADEVTSDSGEDLDAPPQAREAAVGDDDLPF